MSKLGTLLAIPIGLLAIRSLQDKVVDEPDSDPIIPTTTERPKQRDDGTFFGL
jgi:hypothetical protein